MKFIIILGLVVFLGGCAGLKTKNYSPPKWAQLNADYLNTFVGKDITKAQKVFGYKYTTKPLDNHRTAYTWEMDRQVGFGMSLIGSTKTVHCNWTFVTGPKSKILDSQLFGYCPPSIQIY